MRASTQTLLEADVRPDRRRRIAVLLSELLAPWVCAALLPPIVGAATASPGWKGLLLGAMTAVGFRGAINQSQS